MEPSFVISDWTCIMAVSYTHLIEQMYPNTDNVYVRTSQDVQRDIIFEKVSSSACTKLFDKIFFDSYRFPIGMFFEDHATIYQMCIRDSNRGDDVKVIVMGALARDFEQIAYIVSRLPQIYFYICKGRENIDYLFSGLKNATLVGYVPEAELKHYMNDSDISLNVMKDTIGSNVICTSMATGLAMVVSDVGSIRDYCCLLYTSRCV